MQEKTSKSFGYTGSSWLFKQIQGQYKNNGELIYEILKWLYNCISLLDTIKPPNFKRKISQTVSYLKRIMLKRKYNQLQFKIILVTKKMWGISMGGCG